MQFKKLFISFLIFTISVTTLEASKTEIKYTQYTIQSGDTLFVIAKKHRTTTDEVRKANNLEKSELIKVGQILKVPNDTYTPPKENDKKDTHKKSTKTKAKKTKSPTAKSKTANNKLEDGFVEYTIQSGDTVYTIAKKHKTTTREIRAKNDMEYNSIIKIGQKLIVPTNTYDPSKEKKKKTVKKKKRAKKGEVDYSIALGDTIFTIARKHKTTTKEIRELNDMEYGAMIRVGQHLRVPTNTYFPDEQKAKEIAIAKKRKVDGVYEVQSGDTLFSIARKHHVTLKTIMDINQMKGDSIIKIGQLLKVTKNSSYTTKVAKKKSSKKKIAKKEPKKKPKKKLVAKTHKVKSGDTLSRIAKDNGMTVKKLKKLNKLGKSSYLKIGQVLALGKVGVKTSTKKADKKKPNRTYRVKKGDTLSRIAKRYKTTVKRLRSLNSLKRKSKLRKGMVLAIDAKAKKGSKSKSKDKSSKNRRTTDAMAVINGRSKSSNRSSRDSAKIIRMAKKYLGTRYVWGAVGPSKFDCSGFTQYVLRKSKGIKIPRVSRKQAYYGKYVSRKNLRAGDLIFFDTSRRRRGYVNHVGIYIGNNKFIHASSAKHRVVITSLNRPFYRARFKWGRRVN